MHEFHAIRQYDGLFAIMHRSDTSHLTSLVLFYSSMNFYPVFNEQRYYNPWYIHYFILNLYFLNLCSC